MLLDGTVGAKNPMGFLKINGSILLKEFAFHFHAIDKFQPKHIAPSQITGLAFY